MDARQVFLKGRPFFRRIKTVYVKKLMRPVIEETGGIKNPTAHMGKALAFGEIIFASAQVLLRPLALSDVDHRTREFNEIAGRAENRMTNAVDVPDGAIRMHNAIIHFFV